MDDTFDDDVVIVKESGYLEESKKGMPPFDSFLELDALNYDLFYDVLDFFFFFLALSFFSSFSFHTTYLLSGFVSRCFLY